MLHVTTEIGKPGKKEREKRHFPTVHNVKSEPAYKARGRKYIPHNYGTTMEWVPHGQYIEPQLTEAGPDWSSRLRYIPDPENPDYPAAEIWPNNWRSMRPYPYGRDTDILDGKYIENCKRYLSKIEKEGVTDNREERHVMGDRGKRKFSWEHNAPHFSFTYKRSDNEWLLDPGLTKVGLRCTFNGVHKSTATSDNEITHTMLYGKGRPGWMIEQRNDIPEAAPGDKSYQVPEYSSSFHKKGCTRPLVKYGPARSLRTPDTFIPLVPVSATSRETFRQRSAKNLHRQDVEEVKKLEAWKPATPLPLTLPALPVDQNEKKSNKKWT